MFYLQVIAVPIHNCLLYDMYDTVAWLGEEEVSLRHCFGDNGEVLSEV